MRAFGKLGKSLSLVQWKENEENEHLLIDIPKKQPTKQGKYIDVSRSRFPNCRIQETVKATTWHPIISKRRRAKLQSSTTVTTSVDDDADWCEVGERIMTMATRA